MKLDVKVYEEKMKKSVAGFEHELTTIRAGRANAAVLDKISVDYYGAPTQINAIAEVKAADARTLVISPWDASTLKSIEKAILASDLGLQPMNDGKLIRLNFPQPTEEKRKQREDIPVPDVDPLANAWQHGEVRQLQITNSFPDSVSHRH